MGWSRAIYGREDMTNVTYDGPFQAVITKDGTLFKRGESVAVEDQLAKSLAERSDFSVDEAEKKKGDE